jgi:hypothetical protein
VNRSVALLSLTCLLAACSNAAVDKAIGTAQENPQIVISTSASSITIENHVGRPLLNVRVTVSASGSAAPFVNVVPTIGAGEKRDIPLADFRTDAGTLLDGGSSRPEEVRVTARDTLGNSYDLMGPKP